MQVKLQLARLLNGCNRVPLARDDLAGYSFQPSTLWKLSIITMKNVRTSYKYRKSFVLQLTPYNLHITENPKDFFTQHIIHTPYDNYTIKTHNSQNLKMFELPIIYRKSFVLQRTSYNQHITGNPKDFFTQHTLSILPTTITPLKTHNFQNLFPAPHFNSHIDTL